MIAHYLYTVLRALSGEKLWSRDLALEYKAKADEAVKLAREERDIWIVSEVELLDDLRALIKKHTS